MPKHPHFDKGSAGAPGKKPPAPSVKVKGQNPQRQQTNSESLSVRRLSVLRKEAKRWRGWEATRLTPKARQALELLAVDRRGLTETLLRTYGFTLRMLAGLIRSGLATAQRQTVKAGRQTIKVVRISITEAGRQAIES
jgi:hypothetical protein